MRTRVSLPPVSLETERGGAEVHHNQDESFLSLHAMVSHARALVAEIVSAQGLVKRAPVLGKQLRAVNDNGRSWACDVRRAPYSDRSRAERPKNHPQRPI